METHGTQTTRSKFMELTPSRTRAMLHDDGVYGPDVEKFNPERFLKDGVLNPDVKFPDAAFGFGRRSCPGRNLAVDSIFITIASVLATFEISTAFDEAGNAIIPTAEYTSGFIRSVCIFFALHLLEIDCSRPEQFKCSIKPRSEQAAGMIAEAFAVHTLDHGL